MIVTYPGVGPSVCDRIFRVTPGVVAGGVPCVRMHRFPANFGAGLIDDNDRKRGIFEPAFVPEPLCKLLAMLNRTCGGRKLYARSVPDWSAILHIKIIGSHNDPRRGERC